MENGKIVQVIGPVVDVEFDVAPPVYSALRAGNLVLETALIMSDKQVRAIAMGPTDGLVRGDKVTTDGKPISVPVGDVTLNRIWNVLGEAIDEQPVDFTGVKFMPIHRIAPSFAEMSTKLEILETGIKVID
jgi:F-type H+-transporting ATPase subunit beta